MWWIGSHRIVIGVGAVKQVRLRELHMYGIWDMFQLFSEIPGRGWMTLDISW